MFKNPATRTEEDEIVELLAEMDAFRNDLTQLQHANTQNSKRMEKLGNERELFKDQFEKRFSQAEEYASANVTDIDTDFNDPDSAYAQDPLAALSGLTIDLHSRESVPTDEEKIIITSVTQSWYSGSAPVTPVDFTDEISVAQYKRSSGNPNFPEPLSPISSNDDEEILETDSHITPSGARYGQMARIDQPRQTRGSTDFNSEMRDEISRAYEQMASIKVEHQRLREQLSDIESENRRYRERIERLVEENEELAQICGTTPGGGMSDTTPGGSSTTPIGPEPANGIGTATVINISQAYITDDGSHPQMDITIEDVLRSKNKLIEACAAEIERLRRELLTRPR